MFTLPTQPQTIGEILDTGFKLYFKSFKHVFFISLVMNSLWLIYSFVYGADIAQNGVQANDAFGIISMIIGILMIYIIFQVAIIHRINNFATNSMVNIGESFQLGLKIFLPMLLATLLNGLIIMIGLILLLIPGVVLAIYLMLFPVAMTIESCGPVQALQRSMDIVKQNWWRSMLVLTVVMIVYMILYSVIGLTVGITVAMTSPEDINEYAFLFDSIGAIIGTLLGPLAFSMLITLFHDLRLRREGVDIEAQLNEME